MTTFEDDTMAADIYDPDRYVDAVPHDVFDALRAKAPIHYQEMPGEPGYWAVLNHADVVHVAKHPTVFSASEGGVVLENLAPDQLAMMRNMLLAMDPPRHVDYRRPLAPSFTARVIAGLEDRIRTICQEIFARVPANGEVEFVHDVTSSLPSQVIGELMGLPREDWSKIHRWAEMQTSGQDPDLADRSEQDDADGYADASGDGSMQMAMYAMGLAATRRTEPPQDDLTTLILEGDFGGHAMTDMDFGSFFVQLVTAGNDTTKTMLASGLRALVDHPDQMAALRADPTLIPGAVEEILRWANPLHYFRRTATQDCELGGASIKAGDKVAMYYTAANRDPSVFDNPHAFDIRRTPNPHLSFGIAQHFCLGVHLARLEGRVFFSELMATFSTIEIIGEVRRTRSNLNNALKSMPVRLTLMTSAAGPLSAEMHDALDAMVANANAAMVVVTVASGRQLGGCLVGFHTQSSIDPWRYTVHLSHLNHTYRLARRASHLGVHFLGQQDEYLARLFGAVTDDVLRNDAKLDHVSWAPGADGETPILHDVQHWFLGRIVTRHHRDGDHAAVVLEPVAAADASASGDMEPFRSGQARDISPGHPSR